MTAKIIDGKAIAKEIRAELAKQVAELTAQGRTPGLTVVLVGDNPASKVYVRSKQRACEEIGINSTVHRLPEETTQAELLALIDQLNADDTVHGILVQLPLPGHLNEEEVINAISPAKDVDGFHPINVGKLQIGTASFVPCTPAGVVELVKRTGVSIAGQHVVVLGRSNIVGKPAAALFLKENATVTICHSRTKNAAEECSRADILIVAVGRPKLVKKDWVKPGAVVIDVGINRVDGEIVGDVDFAEVQEVASAITPVPGGVGPMTIAMLLKATVEAAARG
ncbi:MAG TPA: bifunctional methylenetetrahydrofolate dehydrogenase/methenyltetrahydrofolate cyclohydrolase FolD [Firmicutes bacterium]|jgi:methylenetetrahydrofolate dehydrogenase (NADP+)/methenyltetrahydrofolate cyclohydrolase|nr:bifunctional methylenetetrahydrofolate dehydrogenase/methenyltetrahydrofolate cyclohydrolase FolD [Bacillota bacterium]HHT43288.1 bifunctional methylenetetrahydrofolate dehydrogenase/methenyltetrahydrofolate cyclohydrolase FolD [Bacillota bacterium]